MHSLLRAHRFVLACLGTVLILAVSTVGLLQVNHERAWQPRTTLSSPTSATPDHASQRINLNTASQAELESLPGIGPTKATAIISHRPYRSLTDVDQVPGIGPATLNELADKIDLAP